MNLFHVQEFILKVIAVNPQYDNVYDIIEHVRELVFIKTLGSKLKNAESDDTENKKKNVNKVFIILF